jgi:hypothetical protein
MDQLCEPSLLHPVMGLGGWPTAASHRSGLWGQSATVAGKKQGDKDRAQQGGCGALEASQTMPSHMYIQTTLIYPR